jgi:uncharacterized protein YndB with AHSA1/START domain
MGPIEKKITVNAPVNRVWEALTNPTEIQKWMMMSTNFEPKTGKDFTFQAEASKEWDGVFKCSVKEVVKNKKLSYTWDTAFINAETLVEFNLAEKGNKTELSLVHSGWDKMAANQEQTKKSHSEGWDLRFVQKLKEVVESLKPVSR